jgi:flagellar hook assembly protein FlgD
VPEQASVKVEVYDVLGRSVKTLLSGDMQAGYHSALWDGTNGSGALVGSGVYYYRIEATGVSGQTFVNGRKMMLLK